MTLGEASFSLGWERFLPAELLFEPQEMVPGTRGGLHELVLACIDATVAVECDGPDTTDVERRRRAVALTTVALAAALVAATPHPPPTAAMGLGVAARHLALVKPSSRAAPPRPPHPPHPPTPATPATPRHPLAGCGTSS